MPIQALILLAILAASAIIFTVVFIIVADRELAKPANGERGRGEGEGRMEREENGTSDEGGRMERERSESPEAERGEGDDIGRRRGE